MSTRQPPPTIVHPPWRTMAEEMLRAKDPELYEELQASAVLQAHLDRVAQEAREAYDHGVDELLKQRPGQMMWALQTAQELVTRDLLNPPQ